MVKLPLPRKLVGFLTPSDLPRNTIIWRNSHILRLWSFCSEQKIFFDSRLICNHLLFYTSSFRCLLLQPQLQLFSCSCSCSWSKKIRIFHEIITLDDHFIVRDSRKQLFNTRKCLKIAKNACFVLQLQLQLQLNSCSCGWGRRQWN